MVPFICNFRGENNKTPRFYLGALNLFILRREQDKNIVYNELYLYIALNS